MVAAAKLALDLAMPTESVGSHQMVLPDREGTWVRKLFEKTVGGGEHGPKAQVAGGGPEPRDFEHPAQHADGYRARPSPECRAPGHRHQVQSHLHLGAVRQHVSS